MRELARHGDFAFVKVEQAADVDRLQIRSVETGQDGFEFFRGLGIVGYARTFKSWLRHFPRPILLAAVRERELIAWVFIEEHRQTARDGSPVYVLRAIETLPELRGKRLGYRLLLLGLEQVTGYVVTKPLTKAAKTFFLRAGFTDLGDEERPPLEPRDFPGYLLLPPHRRRQALERLPEYLPTRGDVGDGSQAGPAPGSRPRTP